MRMTRHAEHRFRQRGFKADDMALLEQYGTQQGDGILMRRKDVQEGIRGFKKRIADLERLEGTMLVVDGSSVITVQRARRWKERSILRRPELAGPRPVREAQ
jgi:hypothetical protein